MKPKVTLLAAGLLFLTAAQATPATIRYVNVNNPNPAPPYTDWGSAATTIQVAVDAAAAGDEILVTNGVYATGGRAIHGLMTNRVAVDKPITLRSVNGPASTIIRGHQVPGATNGDGAIRCAYLAEGAALSGFTLTNGATRASGGEIMEQSGGGLWCEFYTTQVTNCILTGNSAYYEGGGASGGTLIRCTLTGNSAQVGGAVAGTALSDSTLAGNSAYEGGASYGATILRCTLAGNSAPHGGAASEGTLDHCWLTGNSADWGGGAAWSDLYNCTLTGNSASDGGGTFESGLRNCTLTGNEAFEDGGGTRGGGLNNCIVYYNTASQGANFYFGNLNYCCTLPLPDIGTGSITNDPRFLDWFNGNLRLQSNSPCINAGANFYALSPTDLDGNPRIKGGTVDIGAYEFQAPCSAVSYAWLQHYGFLTDGSADNADPDHDGLNNWQEWCCSTDPTNALSVLRLLSPLPTATTVAVSWQSVEGVNYYVERSTDLPRFTALASNIFGQFGTTTYTDTNAPAAPHLYRVGVSPP